MTCLDSTVVADYLEGDADALAFLDAQPELAVPAVTLYEVCVSAALSEYDVTPADERERLAWADVLPFTEDAALAAADLQGTLATEGARLSARDAMIAGTAVDAGVPLASTDEDFLRDELREHLNVRTY